MNTTITHQVTTLLGRGRITTVTRRARVVLARRLASGAGGEAGMSTVEYAVGTIAAAAFGAVLMGVTAVLDRLMRGADTVLEFDRAVDDRLDEDPGPDECEYAAEGAGQEAAPDDCLFHRL